MRAVNGILVSSGFAMLLSAQAQAAVVNFSSDMSTKTGWTATQGGDAGYVAAPDFVHGNPSHSSVTSAVSERQATMSPVVNVGGLDSLTLSFRAMLHNTIAGVNEAVGRIGILESGGTPAAGDIINAFVTLRRVGSIELTVQAADGIGGFTNIVNTSVAMPNDNATGLSGYEFANFTLTRDSAGNWELDAINGYGNDVLDLTATESTVSNASNLNRVWVYDFGGQYNGAETAVYWDTVSVETVIPEPASLGLVALGGLFLVARRRA